MHSKWRTQTPIGVTTSTAHRDAQEGCNAPQPMPYNGWLPRHCSTSWTFSLVKRAVFMG